MHKFTILSFLKQPQHTPSLNPLTHPHPKSQERKGEDENPNPSSHPKCGEQERRGRKPKPEFTPQIAGKERTKPSSHPKCGEQRWRVCRNDLACLMRRDQCGSR